MRTTLSLLFLALALSLSQFAKSHIDEAAAARKLALPAVVPSPAVALTLALGQESFAADVFWLRVLEYYGDSRNRGSGFAAVVPLFDLIGELDPEFCAPYSRAGLMLTSSEIERVRDANRILRKGMERCPNDSYIPFVLGFNLYYFQRRFDEAADVLAIAARRPNAPEILADLASRLKAHTGDLKAAEVFVTQMLEQENDEHAREELRHRLREIDTERVLRTIDRAIDASRAPGYEARSLAELQALGLLPHDLRDPSGGVLGIEGGRAKSSAYKTRLELKESALHHEVWQ